MKGKGEVLALQPELWLIVDTRSKIEIGSATDAE